MARRRDVRTDDALVVSARDGDRDAFAELFTRWFDRVYDVARNVVRSSETAAEVAQDAFVAAWTGLDRLERPEAFGGWLLRITRNRALDRLRREGRSTAFGVDEVTDLHDAGLPDPSGTATPVLTPDEVVAAQDRDGLITAAAVALGERDASLLDLLLRHGLTPAEIADELGVTANNAHQLLFRMRKRLGEAIGAFVLWRRGRPSCPSLAAALGSVSAFDRDALEIIELHARGCDECDERRAALVAPEQLFSAIPLVAAPAALRAQVMDRLRSADVPVPPTARNPRPLAVLLAAAAVVVGLFALLATWFVGGADDAATPVAAAVPTTVHGDPRSGSTTSSVPATIATGVVTPTTDPPATSAVSTSTTTTTTTTTTIATTTTVAVTTTPTTSPPPAPPPTIAPPPPPPPPPKTTTPVTTAAPTTTVKAPKMVRFTVAPGRGLLCAVGTPRRFEWASIGATSAVLTIGGTTRDVAASGTHDACASSGASAKIVVTGPGGTAQRSLVVP